MNSLEPQMNADERRYKHQDVTEKVIGVFYDVYKELRYGFLEPVYQEAMFIALSGARDSRQRERCRFLYGSGLTRSGISTQTSLSRML